MKISTVYFSEDKKVSLTSYIADSSPEMQNMFVRPAMLIFPGGGYYMCSDREAEPIALAYAARGFNAFVMRYTVGEGISFEQPFEEAKAALAHLIEYAADYHIDKDKIAVCGFSAGGHLASSLGTVSDLRPAAMVLGYPCILKSIGTVLAMPVPSTSDYIDAKTPPTFIFSTANDSCVPIENSLVFAEKCDQNKVPFEIHIFSKGGHGLSLANRVTGAVNADVAKWFDLSCDWLSKMLEL